MLCFLVTISISVCLVLNFSRKASTPVHKKYGSTNPNAHTLYVPHVPHDTYDTPPLLGVLNAQYAVASLMAPGVSWVDCHRAAEREVLLALIAAGIVVPGSSIDDMNAAHLGATFMPHGLGHLIGCDTHDVGGYLEGTPERSNHPGVGKLRTSRNLEAGMVLTSEPGCYFINALLDAALADPSKARFLNAEVLSRFRGFGGVRLEDVVVVTETGVSNLTTCPRTIDEVESVRQGGAWPPAFDAAPKLRRQWGQLDKRTGRMVDIAMFTK